MNVRALILLVLPMTLSAQTTDAWRMEADRKIDAHRKGNLTLSLRRNGTPVTGGTVSVRQVTHGFWFGTCVNHYWLGRDDELGDKYRRFISDHFSAVVAENAMKWPYTEPEKGTHTFEKADEMAAFAAEHDLAIRGHTLFWTKIKFKADWMREMEGEPLRESMRNHVKEIVSRYRGKLVAWDVNNEMLNARFFQERVGEGIRPQIFQWARTYDPEVPLFVNEYSILNEPDRVQQYLELIKDLQSKGADVTGIGIQEHAAERVLSVPSDRNTPERQGAVPLTPEGVWKTFDVLSGETDLPIHLTEISFRTQDDEKRADALEKFFRISFAHEKVEAILLWGFWSRAHWLGKQAALVDKDFNLLPAGERLLELLEKEWKTTTHGPLTADGFAFRGFFGGYEGEWTDPQGNVHRFEFRLEKGTEALQIDVQE